LSERPSSRGALTDYERKRGRAMDHFDALRESVEDFTTRDREISGVRSTRTPASTSSRCPWNDIRRTGRSPWGLCIEHPRLTGLPDHGPDPKHRRGGPQDERVPNLRDRPRRLEEHRRVVGDGPRAPAQTPAPRYSRWHEVSTQEAAALLWGAERQSGPAPPLRAPRAEQSGQAPAPGFCSCVAPRFSS
jgi:hypothetical protein